MAYKMKGFSGFKNSPAKQKIDHVGRTVQKIHESEVGIGEAKKRLAKSIKKAPETVKIKISDIKKQLKSAGSKLKLSDVKKSLTKSMKLAGKRATFIPSLFLGATTTATADQPKFKKGDVHYRDPKKKIDFTKKK